MAIYQNFNGATIYKPGSYSKTEIDRGGNFPLGPSGLIGIIGEADAGAPYYEETDLANVYFTAERLVDAKNIYRSGPIVDALEKIFSPASDGSIPSGGQVVWVSKTNHSTSASLSLSNAYGALKAYEYGIGGNRITFKNTLSAEVAPSVISGAINFGSAVAATKIIQDLTITADTAGTNGNLINLAYVDTGTAGSEIVSVVGNTISVEIEAGVSTATQVKAALDASVPAAALIAVAITGTGSNAQAIQAPTFLEGGLNAGTALNNLSFSTRLNGGTAVVHTLSNVSADHNSLSTLASELGTLLGVGFAVTVSGTGIKIALAAGSNLHRNGYGRAFELVDSTPGNLITLGLTAQLVSSVTEPKATLTINQTRDRQSELKVCGGNIAILIGRDSTGGCTAASITIDEESIVLSQTGTGLTPITYAKNAYASLGDLINEINRATGWNASLSNALYGNLPLSALDQVTSLGCFGSTGTKPARIKKDAYDVALAFQESQLVYIESQSMKGLPDALVETNLVGGSKGGTSNTDINTSLEKFTKFHLNTVVPLFCRDYNEDLLDRMTESSSTYTIESVIENVKNHLIFMGQTKQKSERQAVIGYRKSYEDCKIKCAELTYGPIQLVIQDFKTTGGDGVVRWFPPWMFACAIAGARGGAPVGTPLTAKYLNCIGIRHTTQSFLTLDKNIVQEFDPDTMYDDAIIAGITFAEAPRTGGFRLVVDNTTYTRDDNWYWNRGSTIYTGNVIAYNFRNRMEQLYIGKKNTVSEGIIRSDAESILRTFVAQGLTVTTGDAPLGFKNLSVRLSGSTIFVDVVVVLVEGIDFVLSNIKIQRVGG